MEPFESLVKPTESFSEKKIYIVYYRLNVFGEKVTSYNQMFSEKRSLHTTKCFRRIGHFTQPNVFGEKVTSHNQIFSEKRSLHRTKCFRRKCHFTQSNVFGEKVTSHNQMFSEKRSLHTTKCILGSLSSSSSSSLSSSCSWRIRRVSCSLTLKIKLVPPSLLRSSHVPSSFWFIL